MPTKPSEGAPDRLSVLEGKHNLAHIDAEWGPLSEPRVEDLCSVPKAKYRIACAIADRYNCHAELLEALRELVRVMRANLQTSAVTLLDAVEQAEAAIQRAEQG